MSEGQWVTLTDIGCMILMQSRDARYRIFADIFNSFLQMPIPIYRYIGKNFIMKVFCH